MRTRAGSAVVVGVLLLTAVPQTSAPTATAAAEKRAVRWLAMGDSYSSGEGIPGTNPGNAGLQGTDNCVRANGDNTNAKAWSVVAVDQLATLDDRYSYEKPFFVACSGAINDGAATQLAEMRAVVTNASLQKWDVVSFSFGGNNINFEAVLKGCIDLNSVWGAFDLSRGCDVTEAQMRKRINMLAGKETIVPNEYQGTVTLPTLYDTIAGAVKEGGDVIVVGYPQLVEEVSRWSSWRRAINDNCEGIRSWDVGMLRSLTGYLNQQIALAVRDANSRWQSKGVEFHFVDIATEVYETSISVADQRHALCSSSPYLNGITTGVTSGDYRKQRSFHPNQTGHDATGTYLATWAAENLEFPDEVVFVPPVDMTIAEAQLYINMTGFGPIEEDGQYGPATTAAVQRFQRAKRLTQSGLVDAPTSAALLTAAAEFTFFSECGTQLELRPQGVSVICLSDWWYSDIAWSEWTPRTATATATYNTRACDPSCVEDTNVFSSAVQITLSGPQRFRCGDFAPVLWFTVMTVIEFDTGNQWTESIEPPSC